MLGVVARVLLITVVPLAIGMWLRARRPELVAESSRLLQARPRRSSSRSIGVMIAENERVLDNLDALVAAARR